MNHKSFSRKIPHPVSLLSVSDGERENIATMSWLSAVSRKPPLLMVSVSPRRLSHEMVLKSGEFAIMILSDTQKELSTLAGTVSGSKMNKWELPQFNSHKKKANLIKVPVLNNCLAVFECKLVNHLTAGDHTIMIGEIIHLDINGEVKPLSLYDHKYYSLGDLIDVYP